MREIKAKDKKEVNGKQPEKRRDRRENEKVEKEKPVLI